MVKNKDINLGTKDLRKLKQEIDTYSERMYKAAENIVKDLSDYGVKKMEEIYNNAEFKGSYPMDFYVTGTTYDKKVTMAGIQAIYNEFGTGTLGKMSPHPIKNRFKLNDYNTGRTIRPATEKISEKTGIPTGELYWTYKTPNGNIVYTQGTPAQKEGYDSFFATVEKSSEIINKRMKEALKDG